MASADELKQSLPIATPPPITATTPQPPPSPPAAAAFGAPVVHSPHLARFAFILLTALMSASLFIEPFADAAAELRLPWTAVVATLVSFAAVFCASVHFFRSFFLPCPPPAAAAAAAPWEGFGAIAVAIAIAIVGIGVAACLVASGGSAYGGSLLDLKNFAGN